MHYHSAAQYLHLEQRLGNQAFARRLDREQRWGELAKKKSSRLMKLLHKRPVFLLCNSILKCSGLYRIGYRNFLNIQPVTNVMGSPHPERTPVRILQLSDLHLDFDTKLTDSLVDILSTIQADFTVITGDFCDAPHSGLEKALNCLHKLMPLLPSPVFGIMGNHDPLALVDPLEQSGIRMLLNESLVMPTQIGNLAICGIDDPVFFASHDLPKTLEGLPDKMTKILLAHNPAIADLEDTSPFHFILSGHTHGGQICLPSGRPWTKPDPMASDLVAGPWSRRNSQGYTSRGAGACLLPLRFFCPPEITVHEIFPPFH